jgi:VWFA-related protein
VAALLAGLAAAPVPGQSVDQRTSGPTQNLTFGTSTSLVWIPVRVLDGHDRPVYGLGPEDFEIEDAKRAAPIEVFVDVAAATKTSQSDGAGGARTMAEPGHTMGIFVDDIAARPKSIERARLAALRLMSSMAAGDHVVLVAPASGLTAAVGFPTSPPELERLVRRITAHWLLAGATMSAEVRQLYYWRLDALEATLEQLSQYRGPGALVILGRHQSYERVGIGRVTYDRLMDAARRANAAVYLLDCSAASASVDGLGSVAIRPPADSRNPEAPKGPASHAGTMSLPTGSRAGDPFEAVAVDSGGFSGPLGDDPALAIARVLAETRGDYIIGFQAGSEPERARWHVLKVRIHRGGCRVKTRSGYLALPTMPPSHP